MSRRVVAAALLALTLALAGCQPGVVGPDPEASPVKNIILFIGDGMQLENEIATSRYLSGTDRALAWHSFPYQAYVATWDVTSYDLYASDLGAAPYAETSADPAIGYDPALGGPAPYPVSTAGRAAYLLRAATDSAGAATAMATGVKTDTGNIAWLRNDPSNGALPTIAEQMRSRKGAGIGVVTTVPFNHATPAAFVSHNTSRSRFAEIADEIMNVTRPEVVIGAGHPDWAGGHYVSDGELAALRTSAAYVLVERVSGQDGGVNLQRAAGSLPAGKKLFGLFGGPAACMESPVPKDQPGRPEFAEEAENPSLAAATRAALQVLSRGPGFFLMVEAGAIDWANSDNDLPAAIGTVWGLHEAVAAAVDYVDQPGDSVDWTNTLLVVTCDHVTGGLRLGGAGSSGQGELPDPGGYDYATTSHTNELVTLYARGARTDAFRERQGARYPGTIILDNTQIFESLAAAAGLR